MSWPWSQLGLPGPTDLSEVRHAYAEKLKTTHPEEDPEGFQRLHSAYQLASRMARQQKRREGVTPPEPQIERPAPPPGERQKFNFDELLEKGGERPRRPREDDEEQDFDYDELLREEGEQPHLHKEEEEEQDFDFDRLFAEGEAERAEARRRRAEERRRAQAQSQAWARERQKAKDWTQKREQWQRQEQRSTYDRERWDQYRQQEDRWQNTETILHTVEMMYNARAGLEAWQKFFQSPMFQQNKNSLDVIFGLEDFVSTKSLSREVQFALFMAYGFDKGVSRPELRPLYQMLLPAWKAEKKAKGFPWKIVFWAVLIDIALLFAIGPVLDSGLLPGFIIILTLGVIGLAKGWFKPAGGRLDRRKTLLRLVAGVVLIGLTALLITKGPSLWNRVNIQLLTRDPREQTSRYMEQDFGEKMGSLYNMSAYYASDTYSNVFYLDSDPNNKQFLAGPDGDRDVKNGQPGYTTNFPEMMMLWALEDFAYQRKIYNVDSVDRDQKLNRWETGGTFVITLPADGAGEVITDLGELLEELSQEQWYQVQTPQCELVLCSRQMIEGRLILFRWHPEDGAFDAEGVRELYETSFAHSYCAQLIRELELDWDFIREDGEHYTLTNEGTAQMKGKNCYKLFGLNESGAVAVEYYVDLETSNIYCVPGNFWETGNSEEQINFYRLLHWGDNLGVVNLFYPWLQVN